ncbi:MAG: response regulator [Acidobacteriota bacterium]
MRARIGFRRLGGAAVCALLTASTALAERPRLEDAAARAEALEAQIDARLASGPESAPATADLLAALTELTELRVASGQIDLALESGQEALGELGTGSDPRVESALRLHLSSALLAAGRIEEAMESSRQAEALARGLEDARSLAAALGQRAAVHVERGELASGLDLFRRSLEQWRRVEGAEHERARVLSAKGRVYFQVSNFNRARTLWLEARKIYRREGDFECAALSTARIADLYDELGWAGMALEAYGEAVEFAERAAAPDLLAEILAAQADFHLDRGRAQKALPEIDRALAAEEDAEAVLLAASRPSSAPASLGARRARLLGSRAFALLALGESAAAEASFRRLLERLAASPPAAGASAKAGNEDSGWRERLAVEARLALADLERRGGRRSAALALAEQAVRGARSRALQRSEPELLIDGLELRAELQAELGQSRAAFLSQREYGALRSRRIQTLYDERLDEMRTRFELERSEEQMEFARRHKALRAGELARQRQLLRTAVTVSLPLVVLVGLLFGVYRQRQQQATILTHLQQQRRVNAQLREVDRIRDDFLANTSHELRTPLYGIVGLAESLTDAPEIPRAARAALRAIVEGGLRLATVINDILDYSKLRRREIELAPEPVELHSLADVVLTLARPRATGRGLGLINGVRRDLPLAHADASRLQQVLQHLLLLAIRSAPSGKIEIAVRWRQPEGQDAGRLRLEVLSRPAGGRAPEATSAPFVKCSDPVTQTSGEDLGLAISARLVELHGSALCERRGPEGLSFRFDLPEAESKPVKPSADQRSAGAAADEGDADGPLLLVVDDEPIVLQVVSQHLRTMDYRVLTASSGIEALTLFGQHRFDLVLLDVMMPRMSGFQVCREIRKEHALEDLPVLFLSAKGRAEDRVVGFEEGGNDYLTKPIARDELLARVAAHLDLLAIQREQSREIKQLRGLLPICSSCRKIRDQNDQWTRLEEYIDEHSEAQLNAVRCPDC